MQSNRKSSDGSSRADRNRKAYDRSGRKRRGYSRRTRRTDERFARLCRAIYALSNQNYPDRSRPSYDRHTYNRSNCKRRWNCPCRRDRPSRSRRTDERCYAFTHAKICRNSKLPAKAKREKNEFPGANLPATRHL